MREKKKEGMDKKLGEWDCKGKGEREKKESIKDGIKREE